MSLTLAKAYRQLHCEAAFGGFFVFVVHVEGSFPHSIDDRVEGYAGMIGIALQGELRGCDGLDGAHGIALDAWHLYEATDRIASEAKVMFHGYFCCLQALFHCAAE